MIQAEGPDTIAAATDLRSAIDRVLDAAGRDADLIDDVTTVERSRTGVLLAEIDIETPLISTVHPAQPYEASMTPIW